MQQLDEQKLSPEQPIAQDLDAALSALETDEPLFIIQTSRDPATGQLVSEPAEGDTDATH